ncbi:hypothetical protein I5Q34_20870 [Streptomyces sp. AV19]|uniref:hypothetical protein n=1 Tax=Streptomyces sp. AV19 TaxID=2793068 RepID=UPI0018FEEBAA|nr:hypothetical protein [Streptomyces sp. AV19]MBH1936700.1 hypothetical protein [Streptomyces sp. AV19]MDG4532758.1 hypothetical protein [Streptomyces sp. AV19]
MSSSVRPVRIALAGLAAAGLLLAAPTPAAADFEDTVINGPLTARQGGTVDLTVSIRDEVADGIGRMAVESPALAKKIEVAKRNFGHNKADEAVIHAEGRVGCEVRPGTYPVTVRLDGAKKPAASTKLTVTSAGSAACGHGAPADASDGPELSLNSGREPQRGDEAVFTITTGRALLDEHDALTLRSPAFVKPVKRDASRFKEGKGNGYWTELAGMVRCDIQPGTYAVDLTGEDADSPLTSAKLTVPAAMDPANRDFCAGPRAYKEIVDRTSETAPDEDEDSGDNGFGTGAVVGISSAAALVAASVTYFLVVRRRKREPESW